MRPVHAVTLAVALAALACAGCKSFGDDMRKAGERTAEGFGHGVEAVAEGARNLQGTVERGADRLVESLDHPDPASPLLRTVQFDDVPVPPGFDYDAAWSYAQIDGKFRSGRFRYTGDADPANLRAWYARMLPQYGWQLDLDSTPDEHVLFCVKGRERMTVTIRRVRPLGEDPYAEIVVRVKPY